MLRQKKKSRVDPESKADPDRVRAAALGLLARRDFASGALREKLEAQGYDPGVVAIVTAELVEERALDDARYASNYVSYHAERGQGPVRIAADLRALGVVPEVIDLALREGPDWHALAGKVRQSRFGSEPPATWAEKARQARFLQYRGFSSDHIHSATGADSD